MQRTSFGNFKQERVSHQKSRAKLLCFFAFLAMVLGGVLVNTKETYALTCDNNSKVSCIDITFGEIVGGTDLLAPNNSSTSHGIDTAYFYLPVSLTIAHASEYSIKVYSENNGELRSPTGSIIPTLTGEAGKGTSLQDLGKDGSVWGYRYHLDDVIKDQPANYLKVPGRNDAEANIISGQQIPTSTNSIQKVLTLGFATAVDGNLAAGKYSDKIVVAVTATPRQTSAFGTITTMQEMTPEVCKSITTPSKDAELVDATGIHAGDNRYVPEAILTDTRDGHEYLVRKLADGNCWMSQNLSLMFTETGAQGADGKTVALTSANTDLTSKPSWEPGRATETSSGGDWGQNNGTIGSTSAGWNQYWTGDAGATAFSDAGNSAYGGQIGYAQRGNYYSWFAATAGSGQPTDTSNLTDGQRIIDGDVQDSICPKGWRLPSGGVTAVNTTDGSVKSFYNLLQVYTGITGDVENVDAKTLYKFPINFVPAAARYYGGGVSDAGKRQWYWSSGAQGTVNAFNLYLNPETNIMKPGTSANSKGQGLSVRCVSR